MVCDDKVISGKFNSKLSILLNNLPHKIFLKDKDSVYITCNANYAKDHGIRVENIEGKTDYDFYPKLLAEQYIKSDQEVMSKGEIVEFDEEYIENKRKHFVHTTKIPITDETGAVIGIQGIFSDITKQKIAELKLKESEGKYRTFLETSPLSSFIANSDGKYIFVNIAAAKLLGYSKKELLEKTILDLMFEQDKTVMIAAFESLKENGTLYGDYSLKKKDGSKVLVSLNGFALPNGDIMAHCEDITERVKAEEDLKESKAAMARTQKLGKVGGWSFDVKTGTPSFSKAVLDIYEVEPPDVLNVERGISCYAPEHQSLVQQTFEECIETGKPYDIEVKFITTKGKKLWLRALGEADRKNGVIVTVSGFLQDITKRKKAEEALRKNEQKLKKSEELKSNLLEYSPACTKIIDLDFNLQYMSHAGIEGLCIDDISKYYGAPYPFHFFSKSFKDEMTKNLKIVKMTGQIIEQENHVNDINGNKLWFHSTIVPIKDNKGEVDYLMVVSINTTERNVAEELLKKSEEKYHSLFENAIDMIHILDCKGNIIDANTVELETLGYTLEEYTNMHIKEIIHPDYVAATLESMKRVKTGNEVKNYETAFTAKDGRKISVEVNATPRIVNGEVVELRAVSRDITSKKIAEESNLENQNKLINSLNEKTVLIKEIYHRVKNNLQIISSLFNLQIGEVQNDSDKQYFKYCQNRVKSMSIVHNQLYQSENFSNISLKDYVTDLIRNLRQSFESETRNITFKIFIEDITININKAIPCALIMNETITNSIKHAFANKSGEIIINAKKVNDNILIRIKDDGIGIKKENSNGKPNSLGMEIINALVGQLDGKIQIKSNNGTEIKIKFPEK